MTRAGWLAGCAAVVAVAASIIGWQTESTTAAPPSGGQLSGADLFHSKGCASCHSTSTSRAMIDFPPLIDVADWAGDREPGLTAEEYLAESIRTPWAFVSPAFTGGAGPTTQMPQLGLSEAEIDALVDHLLQG